MTSLKTVLAISSLAILFSSGSASALKTTTENVACSSKGILQSKIDSAVPGTVAIYNVTGTCVENITVPQGKTIILKGAAANTKLTPADATLPVLKSQGITTIQNMIVTNATGAAETLVQTDAGGTMTIRSSDLSAPKVWAVVAAWTGSVEINNSRIVGGRDDAVEVWSTSSLWINGDPAQPAGPTGKFETYIMSSGTGVLCSKGGSLQLRTISNGAANGMVTIEKNFLGLLLRQCDFTIRNYTSSRSNLSVKNNRTGLSALQSRGSAYQLSLANNVDSGADITSTDLEFQLSDVTGNGAGMFADQSRVSINGSLFENKFNDVVTKTMTSVAINASMGQSSFPKALTWKNSFSCSYGGRIDIDAKALVQTLGTAYNFLGCLYQH